MIYPIYVHPGSKTTAYGITFPDFPGCFSAADTWEDIAACAQEAVEAHYADNEPVPKASTLAQLIHSLEYEGGAWMMIDVDMSRVNTKTIRLNVSLPENLVAKIDTFAKAHHMSRSAFLARAAKSAMSAPLH